MKKTIALVLSLLMLLALLLGGAGAEVVLEDETADTNTETAADAQEEEAPALSPLEIALTARPDDEDTTLIVGNTTKVNGNFFSALFGNNTSDIDVRAMLQGYNPIVWSNQLQFIPDPQVVTSLTAQVVNGNTVYTVVLADDLVYCDGETPVTAEDYVFSTLLSASKELSAIGAETGPETKIVGYEAYHAGETDNFEGVRLLSKNSYSIAVKGEYEPYFYELSYLSTFPYPISVLAPGCSVADDGNGARIDGGMTAEMLQTTIMDPVDGYISHPYLTAGPYKLVSYDAESGTVEFAINEFFKGNYEGVKPVIDTVTLVPVLPEDMIAKLESGEIDLINKAVDASVINDGLALTSKGEHYMLSYPRLGYGFCALSCEKGPQQFMAVRQALMYAFDADTFIEENLSSYGMPVYGYYGIGQWMVSAAMGNTRPIELTDEEALAWDAITLDSLNPYDLDLEKAEQLLIDDGWTLNAQGEPFDKEKDDVRYKEVDGELMRLSLTFAQCAQNDTARTCAEQYLQNLPQIGAELVVVEVPFTELLSDYYREDGERKYDMNFMATNFVSVFDPYYVFRGGDDFQGAVNTSGLVDDELVNLAWEMRTTEPLDLITYETRWLAMQERYNEVLPTLPIYSNIYFDFSTNELQNYHTNSETNWPIAIIYAYMGEPIQTATDGSVESFGEEDGTVTP